MVIALQDYSLQHAIERYQAGDYAVACRAFQAIAETDQTDAEVWYWLGMSQHRLQQGEHAVKSIAKSLGLSPDDIRTLAHGIEIARLAGELDLAVEWGNRAVGLASDVPAIANNLGLALYDSGSLDNAIAVFKKAIESDPRYIRAYNNLGNALMAMGFLQRAADVYRRAVQLKPDYVQAWNGLGQSHHRAKCYVDAIKCFDHALAIDPGYRAARLNRAITLNAVGESDRSEAEFRQLVTDHPDYAEAWHELGGFLEHAHRYEASVDAYGRALALNPSCIRTLASLENTRRTICDWSGRPHNIDRIRAAVRDVVSNQGPVPVSMLSSCRFPFSAAEQLAIAQRHAGEVKARVEGLAPCSPNPSDSGPIRIGILSHEFKNNVVAHLMCGLYPKFDRSRFRLIGFGYNADDGSELRRDLIASLDEFVDLTDASASDAAAMVADRGVHILVDINSYMHDGRPEIAALRPAPIQVSYMYPATMGSDHIDYFLTDNVATPVGHDAYFAEKLVRMPCSYLPKNDTQPIAAEAFDRSHWGLPEDFVVYCSFNRTDKIEPACFDIWMNVLKSVYGSVLWLRADSEAVKRNLRSEAEARGVPGTRLVFAGSVVDTAQHLARHQHADVFLDTFTHNAHATAVDAIWAGVPVLTKSGETFASRVAASLLTEVGLTDLIVDSSEAYEELAIEMGRNEFLIDATKAMLAQKRSSGTLFDTSRQVGYLEKAFQVMWDRHQSGLSHIAFDVH